MSRWAQKKIGVPPSRRPGQAAEQVADRRADLRACVVLLDVEADGLQLADHAVGDRALLPGRALDRGELEKEREDVGHAADLTVELARGAQLDAGP